MNSDSQKHARYSPSSLSNRLLCPGWENDQSSDKTLALEGTKMHASAETGDLNGLDEEQTSSVKKCLDFIRPLESGAIVFKELKLSILNGLTFGTCDRVIIRGSQATIVDFKFGRHGVTDAEFNLQGWAYTLGVFEKFSVDTVRVIFLSPRRDEVSHHQFSRADYPRLQLTLETVIARAKAYAETKKADMLTPSEDACQYCGNKGVCPRLHDYALSTAKKYAPLELVDDVHSSQITDPARMAKALTLAKILGRWAESVAKHATDMARDGLEIPGYRLAERAGAREINNPVIAFGVLSQFMEPVEIVSCSKLSLTKLEEVVHEKAPRGQKSAEVLRLREALLGADCVTSDQPTTYLRKTRE